MRQIFALPTALILLSAPALAQENDPPSLMERGMEMFFEGLMNEVSPAMEELTRLLEQTGPSLKEFVTEMGPKLKDVLEEVDDWSVYEAPEVLPNGDIIIRRKPAPVTPDTLEDLPDPEANPIEL